VKKKPKREKKCLKLKIRKKKKKRKKILKYLKRKEKDAAVKHEAPRH
jgi:hypothetical protein